MSLKLKREDSAADLWFYIKGGKKLVKKKGKCDFVQQQKERVAVLY